MSEILKRATVEGYRVGGEPHRGWPPRGAATPRPTPLRVLTLEVTIESDGGEGFLLAYQAREGGEFGADYWFRSLVEAEATAEARFGILASDWVLAID